MRHAIISALVAGALLGGAAGLPAPATGDPVCVPLRGGGSVCATPIPPGCTPLRDGGLWCPPPATPSPYR